MTKTTGQPSPGFTLVEVLVALFILTVGVLAMGMSTGHVLAQLQAAELRTERMTAFREASEIVRSSDWDALESTCSNAGTSLDTDNYSVSCTVSTDGYLKVVTFVAIGPGFQAGQFTTTLSDTFSISIAEPVD